MVAEECFDLGVLGRVRQQPIAANTVLAACLAHIRLQAVAGYGLSQHAATHIAGLVRIDIWKNQDKEIGQHDPM